MVLRWLLFLMTTLLVLPACSRYRAPSPTNASTKPPAWKQTLESARDQLGLPWAPPRQYRRWRPDLAVMPSVTFQDSQITIHNVRNARYRSESDYDVRHYDLSFALADVQSVDFLVVPFKDVPLLAHTMLSFGLKDGRHFIISVEARLEQDEAYSAAGGSLRRYELMYVIGDEQDLIPLRTEVRHVDVYLYRGNASPSQVQDLLVDMLQRTNKLQIEPEFYDTLTNNCTTNIVNHVNRLRPGTVRLDPRVLLPGHSDRLAYDLGLIQANGPFEELKLRSRINTLVSISIDYPDFSRRIRGEG